MARPKEITDKEILVAARHCFLTRGAAVSAVEIAKALGVSHTTLFNRFGSKEALMIAALGPSKKVPWVTALEAGPDKRPISDQLIEHGKAMSVYFQDLQAGLSLLQAAGIPSEKVFADFKEDPPQVQSFRGLTHWLRQAQSQKRLGTCNINTLAMTILGVLHSRAFASCACGESTSNDKNDNYVEEFIALLWKGIGNSKNNEMTFVE